MAFRILNIICILFFLKAFAFAQEISPESQALYDEALVAKEDGHLLKAREDLEKLLTKHPEFPQISHVKEEWRHVMWRIIVSNTPVPESVIYDVKSGDSLEKIAKHFGTTIELIKKRNRLITHQINPGQKLSLWSKPFTIYISKSSNFLGVYMDGRIIKLYRVSTGKSETTTPLGEFTIQSRYPNPVWFHKGEIVASQSPENWLGTRWLGFNKPKYGIHGTIYPELIGQSVSGGCIRMKNEDVEELYDLIPIGTKVIIKP